MAAKISTSSILLVSLLYVFITKSLALYLMPSSLCFGPDPALQKCASDCGFILNYANGEPFIPYSSLKVVLESIHAARLAGISTVKFLSSIQSDLINEYATKEWVSKLNSTINDVEHEISQAIKAIRGEVQLLSTKLHGVEKSLKVAAEISSKLYTQVGLKQTNSDTNGLLENLTRQFMNLTNLAIKVIRELKLRGTFDPLLDGNIRFVSVVINHH